MFKGEIIPLHIIFNKIEAWGTLLNNYKIIKIIPTKIHKSCKRKDIFLNIMFKKRAMKNLRVNL